MKQLSISFILILFTFYVAANEQEIRNSLNNILPNGAKIESIRKTEIEGLYEIYYGDLEPIYINEDGSFFIYGDIYKINPNSITNITSQSINKKREVILKNLPEDEFISFKSTKEEFSVIVFTDVDCGYCRKLHKEIDEYNQLGISIKYAAYPRTGLGTHAFTKMVSAWCSDDPKDSLTKLKNDKKVSSSFCEEQPVSKHYVIGQKLGITGTPALFSADGRLFPGYLEPEELLKRLKS